MRKSQPLEARQGTDDPERTVARYLSENPGFFQRHPAVLRELQIPHAVHGAVSLIEHQVTSLRRERDGLQTQMARFVENARSNEELARRLHTLLLELLDADRLDELLTTLYQCLEQRFQADFVSFRLFAEPVRTHNRGLAEFLGADPRFRRPFEALLQDLEPRCGRGDPQQLEVLFPDHLNEVASMAVIPVSAGATQGVLAIASRDPRRHHPGMGTHYLRQLGDVVSRLVARAL